VKKKHTNSLIHETSPYLLQHAHNPVQWYAWGKEALDLARLTDRPILVSIGYSACHWCHVMEDECFENDDVAAIMNDHFVNIKIDREERPDIDQVYMTAVQIMTGHGGWPLNCFITPDGKPFYGGTYFPRERWTNTLLDIHQLWKQDRNKVEEYANSLGEGLKSATPLRKREDGGGKREDGGGRREDGGGKREDIGAENLHASYERWKEMFDNQEGGPRKAPKFPLPNSYQFLIRYQHSLQHSTTNIQHSTFNAQHSTGQDLKKHIQLTLRKMAQGGIYDHVGGGFSRYSTDDHWKVPHFEKMLYDNGQLVTLYSEACVWNPDPLYRETVEQTLDFIARELTSPEGGFYSALDADSEGVEGKFYTWTKDELKNILGDEFALAEEVFNINDAGYWEHDQYILLRKRTDEEIAADKGIDPGELKKRIGKIKERLLNERTKRIRPGLDDKILCSWNGLMLKGYADAYRVFRKDEYLEAAIKNAGFIKDKMLKGGNTLLHSYKNGNAKINGFLEDYCFVIEAYIALYQVTFDESWIRLARTLAETAEEKFWDASKGMFRFNSKDDDALVIDPMELHDNVIPASNSSMAKSLFYLSSFYGEPAMREKALNMLMAVQDDLSQYGPSYSNWMMLQLHFTAPFYETAIVGNSVDSISRELEGLYLPNVIFAGSPTESALPLLKDRGNFSEGKTLIYVCRNQTCKLPVESVQEAIEILK
jgi:uncharacterized protein